MTKRNGFTLIEVMIVIAILGILAAVIAPSVMNTDAGTQEAKHTQCIEGLKFTVPGERSNDAPKQIIGPNGGGVTCDVVTEDSYSTENTWYN